MPFLSFWILVRQNEFGLRSSPKRVSRKHGTGAALSLLVGIVFLLEVGVYGREPCSNNSVLYLTIQGILLVVLFFVSVLAPYDYFLPWFAYVDFGVWIWGSFQVFSAYSRFESDADPLADNYCPPVAFYTAFVFLISTWVIMALAVCIVSLGLFCYCLCIRYCSSSSNGTKDDGEDTVV